MNKVDKINSWEDVYTKPFVNYWRKVFDSNNVLSFDFVKGISEDEQSHIVSSINDENGSDFINDEFEYKDSYIYKNGKLLISVRGWGYLTAVLKLPVDKAILMQDEFGEWIVKSLKGIK